MTTPSDGALAVLGAIAWAIALLSVLHHVNQEPAPPPTTTLDPVNVPAAPCEEVSRMPTADKARQIVILTCTLNGDTAR